MRKIFCRHNLKKIFWIAKARRFYINVVKNCESISHELHIVEHSIWTNRRHYKKNGHSMSIFFSSAFYSFHTSHMACSTTCSSWSIDWQFFMRVQKTRLAFAI